MFIFTKDGRTAYLAFVRNLPAQIVLLSPCFFLPRLKTFNWVEATDIATWLAFCGMFIFAATANLLEFVEATNSKEAVHKTIAELRSSGLSGWRLFLMTSWRVRGEIASLMIVMLAVYGGFGLVVAMVFWAYFPKP